MSGAEDDDDDASTTTIVANDDINNNEKYNMIVWFVVPCTTTYKYFLSSFSGVSVHLCINDIKKNLVAALDCENVILACGHLYRDAET